MSEQYIPSSTSQTESSTLALISLIAGILGWTFLPFAGSLIAVITGHMAKSEIRQSGGQISGDSMATVGLILGYAALGVTIISVCLGLLLLAFAGFSLPFCLGAPEIIDRLTSFRLLFTV